MASPSEAPAPNELTVGNEAPAPNELTVGNEAPPTAPAPDEDFDLPDSRFEVVLRDAGEDVVIRGDFTSGALDAYYFSLLTAFSSRAGKIALTPSCTMVITCNDTDDGDLVPEDLAAWVPEVPLKLSRAAFGRVLRQTGLLLGGVPITVRREKSALGKAIELVIGRIAGLVPSRVIHEEVDDVDIWSLTAS